MSEQRRWTIQVCDWDDYEAGTIDHKHHWLEVIPASDLEAAERRAEELTTRARAFLTAWDGPHAEVEDAYDAVEKHVEELRSALAPPSEPVERECPDCDGTGRRSVRRVVARELYSQRVDCPTCKGTGRVPEPDGERA